MVLKVWMNFLFSGRAGWVNFFTRLNEIKGATFADVNNSSIVDYAICFNHTDANMSEIEKIGIPKTKRILIMLECEAILPRMHEINVLQKYGLIISPSSKWAPDFHKELVNYPAIIDTNFDGRNFDTRKYKFGLIQSNKYSCMKSEMYTFRRNVIKNFKAKNMGLELRGNNWNYSVLTNLISFYKSLKGSITLQNFNKINLFPRHILGLKSGIPTEVKSKFDFLQDVKFAIIIENSLDYVSEKLFDCFKSGTIPIYVGPDLINFGIPENSVIRAPANIDGFFEIIFGIDNIDHEKILNNGKNFLSEKAASWTEMESLNVIAELISDYISINEISK